MLASNAGISDGESDARDTACRFCQWTVAAFERFIFVKTHIAHLACTFPVAKEGAFRSSGSVLVVCTNGHQGGGYDPPLNYILHDLADRLDGGASKEVTSQRRILPQFGVSQKLTAILHSLSTIPFRYRFQAIALPLPTARDPKDT